MLNTRGKYELWYVESINRFQTADGDILLGVLDLFTPTDLFLYKRARMSDILEDRDGNLVKVWFVSNGANDADILYDDDRPPSIFTTWDDWKSHNTRRFIYE